MPTINDFPPSTEVAEFVEEVDRAKSFIVSFVLDPNRWSSFSSAYNLDWRSCQFTKDNKNKVPEQKGIYAFVFQVSTKNLPTHGYILYVGIVSKSSRTLRERYGEYLLEQRRLKRPKVSVMLQKFADALRFYFAPLETDEGALEKLEADLASAVIPPTVTKDFSPRVRKIKQALPI